MRLLFLTNFYPPAARGGYELWCQEVAEGLRANGHEVVLLTSRYASEQIKQSDPDWVYRDLYLEMTFAPLIESLRFFVGRQRRQERNLERLRQLIEEFAPDAILIWGMWNMHRSVAALAEKLIPDRVVYYMGDYWPTLPSQSRLYWEATAQNWITRIPKNFLRPFAFRILNGEALISLELPRVLFPSEFLCNEFVRQGVSMGEKLVIFGAVDTRPLINANGPQDRSSGGTWGLLYAGRLTPDKGVHTAIEALNILVNRKGIQHVNLTIVGRGEPAYETQLRGLVTRMSLNDDVIFLGPQPKEVMPELYHRFDALLFTSAWQEPFGRVLVEAMAVGIPVISTITGGAGEILTENENALIFSPGDARELAEQIIRLIEDPGLRSRLVANGKRVAKEKFDLQRMVVEIENYLQTMVD